MTNNICHSPILNKEKVIALYEKKDGVPIQYVCTTALDTGVIGQDVFYRETPHPEFNNLYFGLYWSPTSGHLMISNADIIESLNFDMIEGPNGFEYSQHRHDFRNVGAAAIDGGRAYTRTINNPNTVRFVVRNGSFERVEYNNNELEYEN